MDEVAAMQNVTISLPDSLKQYVDGQVSAGSYGSVGEYILDLVRADQKRKAKEQLEETLMEALSSGEPLEVTADMWEELRRNIRARAQARQRAER